MGKDLIRSGSYYYLLLNTFQDSGADSDGFMRVGDARHFIVLAGGLSCYRFWGNLCLLLLYTEACWACMYGNVRSLGLGYIAHRLGIVRSLGTWLLLL